ncbi:MAG: hypothetical protein CBD26_00070 [Candidatus Pelagibacter sp. TMED166]|nr:MAG: hypothetical protein CBD26_00070 [Candidatus Pelagibacter sp. TMED166]|tara:strand:+ start:3634 stop:4242 length:609 start_codon:yes stop_codon:yes gene_type:complete
MPYTKEELTNIGFYTEYIDKLRREYIAKLVGRASGERPFRENDVLYSFEDIESREGIENADFGNDFYSTLYTALNGTNLDYFIEVDEGYADFRDFVQGESCSVQTDTIKQTNKERESDKLVDRKISELLQVEIADPLPDGLVNGDTITSDNVNDVRKWLIDGNQKRPFPDLQSFYAIGAQWRQVKTLTQDVIDEIPEGEPVD